MKKKLNKKGFTLIELLAVISILLLIMAIAVPSIMGLRSKSDKKIDDTQQKEFISLAKIVANDYKSSLTNPDKCYYLTLNQMVEMDLLAEIPSDSTGQNSYENAAIKICGGTEITYEYLSNYDNDGTLFPGDLMNTVVYDQYAIPSTGNSSSSDSTINEVYSDIGIDNSGANSPNFNNLPNADRTVAAVYDASCDYNNGCWRVADTSKNWYNYEKGMWANVIVLSETGSYCNRAGTNCLDQLYKHSANYYKANPGAEISLDDISSMLVWIPRFKEESTTNENGYIETNITFKELSDTDVHPAFTKETVVSSTEVNNTDVSGFWVEKFENGGKPLYIYRGYVYYGGPGFINNLSDDMITNYQWGAISMLSLSQYGNSVNSSCNHTITSTTLYSYDTSSDPKEVIMITGNIKETTAYDGRKLTIIPGDDIDATSLYNLLITDIGGDKNVGYCASTSGTIYGIYDMVGGLDEYVFAVLTSADGSTPVTPSFLLGSYKTTISSSVLCNGDSNSTSSSAVTRVQSIRYIYTVQNRYSYNTDTSTDNSNSGDAMHGLYAQSSGYMYCDPSVKTANSTYSGSTPVMRRGTGSTIYSFSASGGNDIGTTRKVYFNE